MKKWIPLLFLNLIFFNCMSCGEFVVNVLGSNDSNGECVTTDSGSISCRDKEEK